MQRTRAFAPTMLLVAIVALMMLVPTASAAQADQIGKATITLQDNGQWATQVDYAPGQGGGGSIVSRGEDGRPVVEFFDNEDDFMRAGGFRPAKPETSAGRLAGEQLLATHCREVSDELAYYVPSLAFYCQFMERYVYDGTNVTSASCWPNALTWGSGYSKLSGPNTSLGSYPASNVLATCNTSWVGPDDYQRMQNRARGYGDGYGVGGYYLYTTPKTGCWYSHWYSVFNIY